ncbi:alpha/beta fold hydrolase [Burkholderia orbicola]|uniref:alpha/beta fold hydrolase n=1 Tax=Burkholderia orbicola TaxID=2978683 RepID=UPI0035C6D531
METYDCEQGMFELGDLEVASGRALPAARLSWKSFGTLSQRKDNVIVYPTSFGAQHSDVEWIIGPDAILDPARWFIVVVDMFGNGLSSSPSNSPDYPPLVTAADNVRAQRRLLTERWGIERLACVYGWSMGAQQAYHWAALFPEVVERIVVNCGSARTSVHNAVFLESLVAALEAAPEYLGNGRFSGHPTAALRVFGRIYAGWALSQDFYREGLHLSAFGASDLNTFLRENWDSRFVKRDAADLLAQLKCWIAGDIADDALYGGDLALALRAIRAAVLLLPGRTDLYFRVEDNALELINLRRAELVPIPSVWGHLAGNPRFNSRDSEFIRLQVRRWLSSR